MSTYQVFAKALGEYGTNAYLLVSGKAAIAIDAPPGALEFYTSCAQKHGLTLKYLLLTHSHFDHISEAGRIQGLGVKVGIHALDASNCEKPGCDGLPLMMSVDPFIPDFLLDKPEMVLEGIKINVLHTPGHTPGGVCFIVENLLFSGDTLFKGSIGNLSFPTGDVSKMVQSLKNLENLKQNYTVYPGHGPKTELDAEKKFIIKILEQIG
jgi:hydroxyacylglutathione hydrolase